MTHDEIDKLWRKALNEAIKTEGDLVRYHFARIVAASEREKIATEGWRQCAKGQKTTQFCALLEEAVKAEREECAKVCEEPGWAASDWCAKAIRKKGEK